MRQKATSTSGREIEYQGNVKITRRMTNVKLSKIERKIFFLKKKNRRIADDKRIRFVIILK
jgi:hypothetical protein